MSVFPMIGLGSFYCTIKYLGEHGDLQKPAIECVLVSFIFSLRNYACPTCGQSLYDMKGVWSQLDKEVENTPMPEEYKEFYVYVLCKDCHKVGLHFCLVLCCLSVLLAHLLLSFCDQSLSVIHHCRRPSINNCLK